MTDQLGAFMDHAAALQRDVDRLSQEVLALALAGVCLAIVCLTMGWRLWHQ
jgi:hypothetical protein